MSIRVFCLAAALIALRAAEAANILCFRDAAVPNDGLAQALNFSGHTVTVATTASEFESGLSNGGYDLAIFAVQQRDAAEFGPAVDALGQWLAGGGKAICVDWSGHATLTAHFQASPTGATSFSRVMLTNGTLATGVTANPFPLCNTGWFRSAWGLVPLAGGTSVAHFENGEAAIVRGNAGRSLIYGYAPDAPRSFATFANGLALLLATPVPAPPLGPASAPQLAVTTATLSATINAGSTPLSAFFDYGLTLNYGQATLAQSFAAGANGAPLSAHLTGLAPHSVYCFRVRAQNAIGSLVSGPSIFVTGNTPPTAANRTARLGPNGTVAIDLLARASDADLDLVSLASVSSAGAGSVTAHADGTATYAAGPDFGASDTFHYTIRDDFGGTAMATVSILAPLGPDTDGDGAPDAWESTYGLDSSNPADAASDLDGDGTSNLAEFLAGTDPQSAASRFAIDALERDGFGRTIIVFTTHAGRSYAVLAADALGVGPWTTIADFPASAATQTVSVTDPDSVSAPARFYMVKTPAEP